MRHGDDALYADNLLVREVHDIFRDNAFFQSIFQCFVVDQTAARKVQQDRTFFRLCQYLFIDGVLGLIAQRHMNGNDIALRY